MWLTQILSLICMLKITSENIPFTVYFYYNRFYHSWITIGNDVLTRQEREGWGAKVIDRLSLDLVHEFPDMKGFSVRNLKYMRKFAGAWRDFLFMQQVAAQIPWFHHCVILDNVSDLMRSWSFPFAKRRPDWGDLSRAKCISLHRSHIKSKKNRYHQPAESTF